MMESQTIGRPSVDYAKPSDTMQVILTLPAESRDLEIAEWMYTILDEYRIKPFPTMPEKVKEYYISEYKVILVMNKKPEDYQSFWQSASVKEYFDRVEKIIHLNERNFKALLWLRHFFKDDEVKLEKICSYIFQYQEFNYRVMTESRKLGTIDWPLFNIKEAAV
jgi:hypothetical protein